MLRGILFSLLLALSIVRPAVAEDQGSFVRVARDASGRAIGLDTSIVRYAPRASAASDKNSFYVDLVSAVHVGEKSYYDELNREFLSYDTVLYELIADRGAKPETHQSSLHPVSMVQLAIKDFLKLQFQLQGINYAAPNFVHADMTVDEFSKSMEDRNESFLQMFMRAMMLAYAKELKGEGKPPDLSLLLLLIVKDRSVILKRVMAEQFEDMETVLDALNGPEGSTLVSERNKVALARLKEQKAHGKKHFAIFYGGAHMPDMAKRLMQDFDVEQKSVRWIRAWNLQ